MTKIQAHEDLIDSNGVGNQQQHRDTLDFTPTNLKVYRASMLNTSAI